MELQASIKTSERSAVTKAALADLEGTGTQHLDALRESSNKELAQMATDAETYLGRVGAAVNTLPTSHDIVINFTSTVDQGLAAGAGGAVFLAQQQAVGAYLASVSPPARASGGDVTAGMPYLVNEQTPNSEIFVPKQSGTIYTQGQWAASAGGGGGGFVVNGDIVLRQASPNPTREALAAATQLRRGVALAGMT
jgi:hypothetical protein